MGLLDTLKAKAGRMKGKGGDLAQQHGDKIDRGLGKAAEKADARTEGKYSSQIQTGKEKARDALDRYAQGRDDEGGGRKPS